MRRKACCFKATGIIWAISSLGERPVCRPRRKKTCDCGVCYRRERDLPVMPLIQTAGTTAARKGSRMVRYFGDAQMYRGHMSAQYLTSAKYIARSNLGLPTGFLDL